MPKSRIASAFFLSLTLLVSVPTRGQGRPNPAALMASQHEAMASLSFLDGIWKGPAWILLPSGEKQSLTQTERVGSFLEGTVKVVEGRGYQPDGSVGFNALAIISYDPATQGYNMRSYAMGHSGDYVVTPTEDGFSWEIPAGPVKIHYSATIRDGSWHEVGDRVVPGQEPVRFFEMTLKRVGDTDWPVAGTVTP